MTRRSRPSWKAAAPGNADHDSRRNHRPAVSAHAGRSKPGLTEGIVRDPADVDMGLILGIGFPAFRGGLLRWADTIGLDKIMVTLAKYEHLGPRFSAHGADGRWRRRKKGFFS